MWVVGLARGRESTPSRQEGRPDLSVIVVTHNRARLAMATLRSASAASGRIATEWILIDSGSDDGTPDAIEAALHGVRVQREPNIGFAAANNLGLQRAHGRYLLLLNPDVEVETGTFQSLLAALDSRPEVGLASVLQRHPDGRLQYSVRRFPSPALAFGEAIAAARLPPLRHWREEEARAARYRSERHADWLVGAFLIVRSEAAAEVGPLDERFFLYSEETDWCYRFIRAGWQVLHLPLMSVIHHTEQAKRPDLAAQLSYAKLLFARKHYGRLRAGAIRWALALRHLLRLPARAAAGRWRPELAWGAAAERHALAVLLGLTPPPFPRTGTSAAPPSTRMRR